MQGMDYQAHRETLAQFAAAWSRGDIDTLMALMSDHPTYRNSAGQVHAGREAVRAGFAVICKPGPAIPAPPPVFFGDICLSYWFLPASGSQTIAGVDVITFDAEGRIAIKDAYRKLAPETRDPSAAHPARQ